VNVFAGFFSAVFVSRLCCHPAHVGIMQSLRNACSMHISAFFVASATVDDASFGAAMRETSSNASRSRVTIFFCTASSSSTVMSMLSVRHAWLQMPHMKRKAEDVPDERLADKRRRMHALERGLAGMTLVPGQPSTRTQLNGVPAAHLAPVASTSTDADEVMPDVDPSLRTHLVPAEPKDARMTRSTWYEPEKDRK
jgi:hypothetical protein